VIGASSFCFTHDPARSDERAQAHRRGGRNSATIVRLRGLIPPRLVPIFDVLENALAEVHAGQLEPGRANAMANITRAMVAVLQAGELEERLRELERKAGTS
jgi:hypothetical protein